MKHAFTSAAATLKHGAGKTLFKISLLALLFSPVLTGCDDKDEDEDAVEQTSSTASGLVYKFKQGDVFYVDLDVKQFTEILDTKFKADTITQTTTFKYVVDMIDENGNANITVTYDRMKTPTFDSKDSSQHNTQEGLGFAGMLNYQIKIKMNSKGYVSELTGADNFITYGQPDTIVNDNESIRIDMNQFFNILPDGEAKANDTWTNSQTVSFGFPAVFNNKYTLKSQDASNALIEFTSEVTPNEKQLTYGPRGMLVNYNLKGSRVGSINFDVQKGMIKTATYEDQYKGEISAKQTKKSVIAYTLRKYSVRIGEPGL